MGGADPGAADPCGAGPDCAPLSISVAAGGPLQRGRGLAGELEALLAAALAAGFPPSLSLALVGREGIELEAWGGCACLAPERVPAGEDTIYDLASLTKVVCSTTLTLQAAEQGRLSLDDPVRALLGDFPVASTTLRHLLTHTSGLVDHRPFFETCQGRAAVERALYAEAAGSRPGAPVCYSDLNFMLVGWCLEACLGQRLDGAFSAGVAAPLSMGRTGFRPLSGDPGAPAARVGTAATELDGDQRNAPGLVWGEVHDGNAWALGGVAGHAGLFAPRRDLARFVQAMLDPVGAGLLGEESASLLVSRQAATGDDVRSLGWRLEPLPWGDWPAGTIWHTGFTGTSLLVSPARGVAVVLLMNGVHPVRHPEQQAAVRTAVHRIVAEGWR